MITMRTVSRCLAVVGLALSAMCGGEATAAEKPELKLLFLGDTGHHRPADRFAQLRPVLAARGVELYYADTPTVLDKSKLAAYDGLVLYANLDRLSDEQEHALLEFVASGKGFVPLHCASYCFRNSKAFVELVGAQFQKHGGEVFPTEIAEPRHPIMDRFEGFSSWDETYVHTLHNDKNREILEYRRKGMQADGNTREPWTWVRTHGKGRVFYTAWGHDERTWGHPGFANLVERGIRWACGKDPSVVPAFRDRSRFEPLPMTELAASPNPFSYVDVGPKIPNYGASKEWGAQGSPHSQMQKPLAPSVARQRYSVPVGFELQLFASEPELGGKPIFMTWDERGRLWVCETFDYPNELMHDNLGRDRIRICEDTDHDGKADRFTVFADKLSIPTAIAFHHGGVVVQNGSETLFLQDTNGDDQADVRELLITNWGMGDTHGGVSNFQYGLDNWLWGMQGYNQSQPTVRGEKLANFRMGFFRFRFDGAQRRSVGQAPHVASLEFLRSTNNNTWGLGFSEEGLVFGSTANRNPSVYMPIPNRYYERVKGWGPTVLGSIADSHLFQAITPKLRQVDHHNGYTAAAGHALYTARKYPEQFWNRTAFVCEPTGHLVGTFVVSPRGSDFASTSPMNLVASDDEWAAPIMAEVGPDGNVWILDWYNYIVQHNPTPKGFTTGKGNAYESELRDKKHGRVYRLVHKGTPGSAQTGAVTAGAVTAAVPQPDATRSASTPLSSDRPDELVPALRRDNLFWRRHAQRLLVERRKTDVVPALVALVNDPSVDTIGLNVGAIHALWTLHGLGAITSPDSEAFAAVVKALAHPSPGVRRNALQVLPPGDATLNAIVEKKLVFDAEPQVRLAAILALADLPATGETSRRAGRLVAAVVQQPDVTRDPWLTDACTSAAAVHAHGFLEGLSFAAPVPEGKPTGQPALDPRAQRTIGIVAEHMARGRPAVDDVRRLLDVLEQASPEVRSLVLSGLVRGWPADHGIQLPKESDPRLIALLKSTPSGAQGHLLKLAPRWGSGALTAHTQEIAAGLAKSLADAGQSEETRLTAARQLISLDGDSASTIAALLDSITPRASPEYGLALIEALSESQSPLVAEALLERSRGFTPRLRQAAVRVLLGRATWTARYLAEVKAGKLQLTELSLDQKQSLAAHSDAGLRKEAQELLKQTGGLPSPDRVQVLQQFASVAESKGNADAGKEIYKKQCAKCHVHGSEGARIGPDLTGMAVHPKHEILVHVLDPNRSVEGNFRIYTVLLKSGRNLSGMLAAESRTAIELVDTEAKRHSIARDDIEELTGSRKSLMPEGFEKQINPGEMTDLLEFLAKRGRYTPLDLRKVATVVSTKGMFFAEASTVERLVFDDWSPKTYKGVPFSLVDPQGDRVPNVVLLHGPQGQTPPKMPKSVTLACPMPVKSLHLLSGVSGWGFPLGEKGSVSLIVRLNYADGQTEEHELKNGLHFADYIRVVDVPESQLAFKLRSQQIRYLAIHPKRVAPLTSITLLKGPDKTAPVVMAITAEGAE